MTSAFRRGDVGFDVLTPVLVACALTASCRPSAPPGRSDGYWSVSCVTGDERYLLAGGDHAALIDVEKGSEVARLPGMVKAVGCETSSAVLVGYASAVRLPSQVAVKPAPEPQGDVVLGITGAGAWVGMARASASGGWRGPARAFVTRDGKAHSVALLPEQFGAVGRARTLPTLDTFATRWGNLLGDGRVAVAAGWQPTRSGGSVEKLPWGIFAVDPSRGTAALLAGPLESDVRLNQSWPLKVAATADGSRLAVAAHDGQRLTLAQFERDALGPARRTTMDAPGAPNALSLSEGGTLVAVAIETRGREAPARVVVVDQGGKTVWSSAFSRNVAGLHFLRDGSLVVAAGEASALRVALPTATERWRTGMGGLALAARGTR